nr:MAG TPA: hypothetical protein [Crassvirales sp.]
MYLNNHLSSKSFTISFKGSFTICYFFITNRIIIIITITSNRTICKYTLFYVSCKRFYIV